MKKNLFTFILLLLQCLAYARNHTNPVMDRQELSFRENRGQVRDQHGAIRKDIDFVLNAPELTLFIGRGQLHYQFSRRQQDTGQTLTKPGQQSAGYKVPGAVSISRIDMTLENASGNAVLVKEKPKKERFHYYTGTADDKAAITDIHSYGKITYQDIYPHIDWVLYTTGKKLKYDFIVRPGGRVEDIKLKYAGTEKLQLKKDGSLCITGTLGVITEEAPYVFEEESKKHIRSSFTIHDKIVGFKTDAYQGTLIVDPGVHWGTYFGGAEDESPGDIACDSSGNIYMCGSSSSLSNIATTGVHQSVFSGATADAFLAKFDSLGQLQWATYYGGMPGPGFLITTQGIDVSCDRFGHVYLAGLTRVDSGMATPGTYMPSIGANYFMRGFLAQFNANGTRNWGTYYGASIPASVFLENSTFGYATACDNSGNVYLGGYTDSMSSYDGTLATTGAHQSTYGGAYFDGFLAKFDSSGNRLWGTYYGGEGVDYLYSIVCDGNDNVYITGITGSAVGMGTAGTLEATQHENSGGFVAKFNSSGVRQWGTYIHGHGYGLAIDSFQHLYVTGSAQTSFADTMIFTPGCHQSILEANSQFNGFLLQLNQQNGTRNWGTYYGSENPTFIRSVACDVRGNVFLTGYTSSYGSLSTEAIATSDSHQDFLNATPGLTPPPDDAFLVQFDTSGQRKWATYYGGTETEWGYGVACSPAGAVYLTGYTQSSSAIATSGSYQAVMNGVGDVFLARFLPVDIALEAIVNPQADTICGGVVPVAVFVKNKGSMDKNDSLKISYSYTGPASGSFDTAFAGGLDMAASDTFSLGNLNFSFPGTYEFVVYLHYTRDDNEKYNDTLRFGLVVTTALPVADINVSQIGTVFHFSNNNAQPSDLHQWDFGDGVTSNDANPTHQYAVTDSYLVRLIVTNFCGSDTATVMVAGIGNGSSIDQPEFARSVAVYPNPAKQLLFIEATGDVAVKTYVLVNVLGQTVQNGTLTKKSTVLLNGLASGSYTIRILTDKGWLNKQIQIVSP